MSLDPQNAAAAAIQTRTPDTTQEVPWSKDEILMRLELIRYHLGWVEIGLKEYGVDVEMSQAIARAEDQFRKVRSIESEIYRTELLRK